MANPKISTLSPWAKPGEIPDLNPNATPAERMARRVAVRRVKARKARAKKAERAKSDPKYAEILRKKDRERYNSKRRDKRNHVKIEYNRKYRQRNDVVKKSKLRYDNKGSDIKRAHWMVSYAIRTGKLERKPCHICDAPESHAHHDDYSKPLEVRWLCRKCHGREHSKFKFDQHEHK